MPEIPAEAVDAAAEALADYETAPHGDVRLNSQRAAAKAVATAAPRLAAHERRKMAEEIAAYEDLLGSIWLYISWREVTRKLTTEQKEMFADAVEASDRRMHGDGEPFDVDRWWRDNTPTRQTGDARDPR